MIPNAKDEVKKEKQEKLEAIIGLYDKLTDEDKTAIKKEYPIEVVGETEGTEAEEEIAETEIPKQIKHTQDKKTDNDAFKKLIQYKLNKQNT